MKRIEETTPEQRLAVLNRVDALRKAEGLSLRDAWAKAGEGGWTNYYTWKRKSRKAAAKVAKRSYRKRNKIVVEAAPAPHIVATFCLFSDGNIINMADLKRAA